MSQGKAVRSKLEKDNKRNMITNGFGAEKAACQRDSISFKQIMISSVHSKQHLARMPFSWRPPTASSTCFPLPINCNTRVRHLPLTLLMSLAGRRVDTKLSSENHVVACLAVRCCRDFLQCHALRTVFVCCDRSPLSAFAAAPSRN